MSRENIRKIFITWLEEAWEEIEIQLYGIVSAFLFFLLLYLFFKPSWMIPFIDYVKNIKLFFYHYL